MGRRTRMPVLLGISNDHGHRSTAAHATHDTINTSKSGPKHPRRKFLIADTSGLALGLLSAGDGDDLLENAHPHLLERFRSIENRPGVDVHVVGHALVHR